MSRRTVPAAIPTFENPTGTVESAARPEVIAAAGVKAKGDEFYGPSRVISGPPAVQSLWKPMKDMNDATCLWDLFEELIDR